MPLTVTVPLPPALSVVPLSISTPILVLAVLLPPPVPVTLTLPPADVIVKPLFVEPDTVVVVAAGISQRRYQ